MKAVLFDWDGVLIDSANMYYQLYCQLAQKFSKVLPIHNIDEFREWYDPAWENNYLAMGFTREDLPAIADFIHQGVDYAPLHLFPGVCSLLASLHRDFRIAIVSTTPKEIISERLKSDSLQGYIDYITGNDGVSEKISKISHTLQILGCREAVMIGDTPLDIASGQANNLPTVGATYGWVCADRVRQAHPTIAVDSSLHLEEAIRSLLK
ncbi:MAG: HAD family hydrolase [bacterium]|nr:HAD family hydrolase [bacterium]